jgi:ribonuclease J
VQQAAEVAIANGRKVAVVGRSMRKNMNISRNLGYVDLPTSSIVSPKEAMDLPPRRGAVLCTGSQGEPMSALTRIAYGDHPNVTVESGDTVIISAKPVPGTSSASTTRSTGSRGSGRRCCTRRSRRARLRARLRRGAAHAALARAPARRHADPRRVPHAGRARRLARRRRGRRGCDRDRGERLGGRAHARTACGSSGASTRASRSSTGSASATWRTSRSRPRRLSEDGVLIVVTTVALDDGGSDVAPPELIARGVGEDEDLIDELRDGGGADRPGARRGRHHEIKLVQEHIHDGIGQVVYDRTRRGR